MKLTQIEVWQRLYTHDYTYTNSGILPLLTLYLIREFQVHNTAALISTILKVLLRLRLTFGAPLTKVGSYSEKKLFWDLFKEFFNFRKKNIRVWIVYQHTYVHMCTRLEKWSNWNNAKIVYLFLYQKAVM